MVSCDGLHGRLLKFSTKTGRKVGPYAQTSVWIRPWTSRDEGQHRQLEQDIRTSFRDISVLLGVAPEPALRRVHDLVKEIHEVMRNAADTTKE